RFAIIARPDEQDIFRPMRITGNTYPDAEVPVSHAKDSWVRLVVTELPFGVGPRIKICGTFNHFFPSLGQRPGLARQFEVPQGDGAPRHNACTSRPVGSIAHVDYGQVIDKYLQAISFRANPRFCPAGSCPCPLLWVWSLLNPALR